MSGLGEGSLYLRVSKPTLNNESTFNFLSHAYESISLSCLECGNKSCLAGRNLHSKKVAKPQV